MPRQYSFFLTAAPTPHWPNDNMFTPLHTAAHSGHLELVKLLLEGRSDPNAVDKWMETPLYLAAQKGHAEVARLLLDSGADATLANDGMIYTVSHRCIQSGNLDRC
jgi:ankyrin repeat protein